MLCRQPYMVSGSIPVGCGQCMPCRINRRRLWSWRMYLESLCHDESSFVTLTYDDAHLPPGGTLQPVDFKNWLKRFRQALAPRRLRFYGVGEYGDQTWRPHYHAILFGVGVFDLPLVERTWSDADGPIGMVHLGECSEATCQYVAGYVTKKMTRPDDPRLNGLHPEFSRSSNRPGIGAPAMVVIADRLHTDAGLDEMILRDGDVPHRLQVGRRSIPLGRYLRERLRVHMGMPEHVRQRIKDKFTLERSMELLALWRSTGALTTRDALVETNLGRIQSVEARAKIRASQRTL